MVAERCCTRQRIGADHICRSSGNRCIQTCFYRDRIGGSGFRTVRSHSIYIKLIGFTQVNRHCPACKLVIRILFYGIALDNAEVSVGGSLLPYLVACRLVDAGVAKQECILRSGHGSLGCNKRRRSLQNLRDRQSTDIGICSAYSQIQLSVRYAHVCRQAAEGLLTGNTADRNALCRVACLDRTRAGKKICRIDRKLIVTVWKIDTESTGSHTEVCRHVCKIIAYRTVVSSVTSVIRISVRSPAVSDTCIVDLVLVNADPAVLRCRAVIVKVETVARRLCRYNKVVRILAKPHAVKAAHRVYIGRAARTAGVHILCGGADGILFGVIGKDICLPCLGAVHYCTVNVVHFCVVGCIPAHRNAACTNRSRRQSRYLCRHLRCLIEAYVTCKNGKGCLVLAADRRLVCIRAAACACLCNTLCNALSELICAVVL